MSEPKSAETVVKEAIDMWDSDRSATWAPYVVAALREAGLLVEGGETNMEYGWEVETLTEPERPPWVYRAGTTVEAAQKERSEFGLHVKVHRLMRRTTVVGPWVAVDSGAIGQRFSIGRSGDV